MALWDWKNYRGQCAPNGSVVDLPSSRLRCRSDFGSDGCRRTSRRVVSVVVVMFCSRSRFVSVMGWLSVFVLLSDRSVSVVFHCEIHLILTIHLSSFLFSRLQLFTEGADAKKKTVLSPSRHPKDHLCSTLVDDCSKFKCFGIFEVFFSTGFLVLLLLSTS